MYLCYNFSRILTSKSNTMTLQERAFVINLIERKFEKKIFYSVFCILNGFIFGTLSVVITPGKETGYIAIASWLLGLFFIIAGVMNLALNQPWSTKKSQFKALDEQLNANFEDLIHSVPLKEFFE